jgi:hypothetical protein
MIECHIHPAIFPLAEMKEVFDVWRVQSLMNIY